MNNAAFLARLQRMRRDKPSAAVAVGFVLAHRDCLKEAAAEAPDADEFWLSLLNFLAGMMHAAIGPEAARRVRAEAFAIGNDATTMIEADEATKQ